MYEPVGKRDNTYESRGVVQQSSSIIQFARGNRHIRRPTYKSHKRRRDTLSGNDLSRQAQHTAGAFKVNGKKYTFSSGGGLHAEDKMIAEIKNMARNNELGPKGNVTIKMYVTKSPCTSKISTYVKTTNKVIGCTQELKKLHNKVINGYKIKIKLFIWRVYQPQIAGAKQASIHALESLHDDNISVHGIDSDDSIASEISSTVSAEDWRDRQRIEIEQ